MMILLQRISFDNAWTLKRFIVYDFLILDQYSALNHFSAFGTIYQLFSFCTIQFDADRFRSIFKTKNSKCLTQSGIIHYLTSQNFYSYTCDSKVKRIVIILGKIHSLLTYTTPHPSDIFAAWFNLLIHFLSLDYPLRLLVLACKKMFFSTKDDLWKSLASVSQKIKLLVDDKFAAFMDRSCSFPTDF